MPDIEIWQLTEIGSRAARNPGNPNDPVYKIISFLDFQGTATTGQIIDYVVPFFPDVDYGEISMDLRKLAKIGIIEKANKRVMDTTTV